MTTTKTPPAKKQRLRQKRPRDSARTTVGLTMSVDTYEQLKTLARYNNVTVSFMLNKMLERPVKYAINNTPLAFDDEEHWPPPERRYHGWAKG